MAKLCKHLPAALEPGTALVPVFADKASGSSVRVLGLLQAGPNPNPNPNHNRRLRQKIIT